MELNNKECCGFTVKENNRVIKNDIIIFRIISMKDLKLLKLNKLFYKKNNNVYKIIPIEFFKDSKELYFYINTNNLKNFSDDIFLNFDFTLNNKIYKDVLKIFVKTKLEYLPKYYENINFILKKPKIVYYQTLLMIII